MCFIEFEFLTSSFIVLAILVHWNVLLSSVIQKNFTSILNDEFNSELSAQSLFRLVKKKQIFSKLSVRIKPINLSNHQIPHKLLRVQ